MEEGLECQVKEFGLFFSMDVTLKLKFSRFIRWHYNRLNCIKEKWKKMEESSRSEVVIIEVLGNKGINCGSGNRSRLATFNLFPLMAHIN